MYSSGVLGYLLQVAFHKNGPNFVIKYIEIDVESLYNLHIEPATTVYTIKAKFMEHKAITKNDIVIGDGLIMADYHKLIDLLKTTGT